MNYQNNFNNIQKANNTTSAPSITLNGDIVLQGVNDVENFAKKYPNMPKNIVNAGPKIK